MLTPVENGLQINHRSKKHFFDFWITYPQNTLPGYTRQEHFWGGLSSTSQIVNAENFAIRSVAQATVFHAGGQSISSGLPVTTSLHAALGIKSEWQPDKWVKRVLLDPYWLYSSTEPDLQGNAVYLNMTVDTRVLKLMVSYWNGRRFDNSYGGDLFASTSRNTLHPGVYEPRREWIMVRLIKEIDLGQGLSFSGRFEPYLNLSTGKLEHSEGVYLTYALREKLFSIRK